MKDSLMGRCGFKMLLPKVKGEATSYLFYCSLNLKHSDKVTLEYLLSSRFSKRK